MYESQERFYRCTPQTQFGHRAYLMIDYLGKYPGALSDEEFTALTNILH
jgi:hypothetical protein